MAKTKLEIKFSVKVTKNLNKNKLQKAIIQSTESSPVFRKEIARVFQVANRRIQNIEKTGEFSPAVASLGLTGSEGYSKFRIGKFNPSIGGSWSDLKQEYAKAVAFLQQPTSSASGTKEFNRQVKKQLNIDDKLYDAVKNQVLGAYTSISPQLLNAIPYTDMLQELYDNAYVSSSSQMERDAKQEADNLQKAIDENARQQAEIIDKALDDIAESIKDAFKMWGTTSEERKK